MAVTASREQLNFKLYSFFRKPDRPFYACSNSICSPILEDHGFVRPLRTRMLSRCPLVADGGLAQREKGNIWVGNRDLGENTPSVASLFVAGAIELFASHIVYTSLAVTASFLLAFVVALQV